MGRTTTLQAVMAVADSFFTETIFNQLSSLEQILASIRIVKMSREAKTCLCELGVCDDNDVVDVDLLEEAANYYASRTQGYILTIGQKQFTISNENLKLIIEKIKETSNAS